MPKFKVNDRLVFRKDRAPSIFGYAAYDGAVAVVSAPYAGNLGGHPLVDVVWGAGANGQSNGAYYEEAFDLMEETDDV